MCLDPLPRLLLQVKKRKYHLQLRRRVHQAIAVVLVTPALNKCDPQISWWGFCLIVVYKPIYPLTQMVIIPPQEWFCRWSGCMLICGCNFDCSLCVTCTAIEMKSKMIHFLNINGFFLMPFYQSIAMSYMYSLQEALTWLQAFVLGIIWAGQAIVPPLPRSFFPEIFFFLRKRAFTNGLGYLS